MSIDSISSDFSPDSMTMPVETLTTAESIDALDLAALIELTTKVFDFISIFPSFCNIASVHVDCDSLASKEMVQLPQETSENTVSQDPTDTSAATEGTLTAGESASVDNAENQSATDTSAATEVTSTTEESAPVNTENQGATDTPAMSGNKLDRVFQKSLEQNSSTPAVSGNALMRLWTYIRELFF